MEKTPSLVSAQDRLAAALAYLLFFIPILMDRKSEYTTFHMKQAFLLDVAFVVSAFIPVIGGLIGFVAFIHAVFLAWKAYSGEKYAVSYLFPYAEKLITLLGMGKLFTPGK